MTGFTNIKSLLLYIKNSFEFNDNNWKDKAIEFISYGVEQIGCSANFIKAVSELEVEDYRVVSPVTAENIIEVQYGDTCCEIPIINTNLLFQDCKCCIATCGDKFAEINDGWIHFSFETGTVKVFYFTLPLDDDGYPKISNDAKVFEALSWWVAYKMILSGNKHHTLTSWKEAYDMWRLLKPQAQNSLKEPTVAFMKLFGNAWTNPLLRASLDLL